MNTPPLLIGAVLAFWGWLTGFLLVGSLMGVVIEASRLRRFQWEFSDDDYNQVWNLCTVLFGGGAIYAFTSNDGAGAVASFFQASSFTARSGALNQAAQAVYIFVQWLPMIFYPMLLVQAFGSKDKIEFSTFSWLIRRKERKERRLGILIPAGGLNISWVYFVLCLISASALSIEDSRYFAGSCVLCVWALWKFRSPRFHPAVWIVLMLIATLTAFEAQIGLKRLQTIVEQLHAQWLSSFATRGSDPKESFTAIGRVGRLKLSNRIVLRIKASQDLMPLLLREATYDRFRGRVWAATKPEMNPMPASETNESTWLFVTNRQPSQTVKISTYLRGGKGVLSLPHGAVRADNLNVASTETNRFGAVRVSEGPGLLVYDAGFQPDASSFESPAGTNDVSDIPDEEKPVLSSLVRELKLDAKNPRETLNKVAKFFQDNFTYTTWLKDEVVQRDAVTPLSIFLTSTRSGHCEYFATASTLLLRAAGIPTRYVVGYSVSERKGKEYIARERDAHAWCNAWIDNHWVTVDNTPASWHQVESGRRDFWEPIKDFFSDLWYRFSLFRWGKSNYRQYAVWLVVPLIVVIVVRLFRQNRKRKSDSQKGKGRSRELELKGLDSELFEVERRLAQMDLGRMRFETMQDWMKRVESDPRVPAAQLRLLLSLHYRLRFDPEGLEDDERRRLRDASAQCLQSLALPKPQEGR